MNFVFELKVKSLKTGLILHVLRASNVQKLLNECKLVVHHSFIIEKLNKQPEYVHAEQEFVYIFYKRKLL